MHTIAEQVETLEEMFYHGMAKVDVSGNVNTFEQN